MPINPIVLQRRHSELGRIRLGQKNPDRGFPMKLDRFRFTSTSQQHINDLATLYGGEPRPWDNSGVPSFEVLTEATNIPVIAVKGGLSQWMEYWSGGGCIHRCDGETNVLTGEPCDHDEQVKQRIRGKDVFLNPHAEAKPTTRLSVMLPELEAIGVWRMESKGWNAAAEIPAVAELAQFVGELVPARLLLQERRTVRDGETSRFVVPVLDLQIGAAKLREVVAAKMSGAAELSAAPSTGTPAAIEAPATESSPEVTIPTPEQLDAAAQNPDLLRRMIGYLEQHGLPDHPATVRARELLAAAEPQPDADGAYEAEIVEDPAPTPSAPPASSGADPDLIWQQILKVAGTIGITLADLEDDFSGRMGGITSADASASELQMYLDHLTKRASASEQVPA